ncbi:hypothetical protein CS0771_28360 [Catellatospora sp. IY07-71]|uniref:hypothetical protein n=1 Tax=Catellatospora sp. IY07-71 TaxID=2728827 RepID=UPI001BB338E7|nr:hypothetical protein [Catellatospora sp. IY07-71]BCJ73292.1 hypothetical protein CS0771_28360 [Catellatospora sp. IY07-71]
MTSHAIPGTTVPARTRKTARIEGAVLVLILLAVGGAAGAASFTHVHDWTMHNSPSSTGDWFGWANAVITELVPIAACSSCAAAAPLDSPSPTALLGAALVLSVTAQRAVAKPGFSGGLVSVIPALAFAALAFAALAKLVLGKTPALDPEPAPVIVPDRPHDRPHPVPAPLTTAAPTVAAPPIQEPRAVTIAAVPAASPAVLAVEDDADDSEDVDQVVTANWSPAPGRRLPPTSRPPAGRSPVTSCGHGCASPTAPQANCSATCAPLPRSRRVVGSGR